VLPQARRFTELGVTADSPIGALDSVDALARVPTTTPAADDAAVSETDVEGAATRRVNDASNAPLQSTTSGAGADANGASDTRGASEGGVNSDANADLTAPGESDARNT